MRDALNKDDLYNRIFRMSIEEIVKRWENGDEVISFERSGINEEHEYAIQHMVFELCKDKIKDIPKDKTKENKNKFFKTLESALLKIAKDKDLSYAQAGSIINLASLFMLKGYTETLTMCINEHRQLLIVSKEL